eukprot:3938678-Rhodomonas_salina.3
MLRLRASFSPYVKYCPARSREPRVSAPDGVWLRCGVWGAGCGVRVVGCKVQGAEPPGPRTSDLNQAREDKTRGGIAGKDADMPF